jgi:hypothetical protein
MDNCSDRKQISSSWTSVVGRESAGRGMKERLFCGDENGLHLDFGSGYTTVSIYQKSLNCTPKKGEF